MEKSQKDGGITREVRRRDAHPDASGFAPGEQPEKPDGMWHSDHPDAHGWHHSSTK